MLKRSTKIVNYVAYGEPNHYILPLLSYEEINVFFKRLLQTPNYTLVDQCKLFTKALCFELFFYLNALFANLFHPTARVPVTKQRTRVERAGDKLGNGTCSSFLRFLKR